MRTPLSIISQFLNILQALISYKEDEANEEGKELDDLRHAIYSEDLTKEDIISNINLQVNLLLSFVNDLLDLARIEEGIFSLDQSEFSFHKMLHETYLMFKRHAEMQDKKLIYSISKSMPSAIYGDKMRLQ